MWLITRPFVYVTKLLRAVLMAPRRAVKGQQRRTDHKIVRDMAKKQGS
ncbi:MAG: hypothetical protein QOG68_1399 [Solirubrobacteraceae bacterium]|jgi:hypothetical protein|nr:hypothetical protein [Solirubrobacteraceae bacterium]